MKRRLTKFLRKRVLLGCAVVLMLSAACIMRFGTTAFVVTLLVLTLMCLGAAWFFSEKPAYIGKDGRLRLANRVPKS